MNNKKGDVWYFFPSTGPKNRNKNKNTYANVKGTQLCYLRVLTPFPVAQETVLNWPAQKKKKTGEAFHCRIWYTVLRWIHKTENSVNSASSAPIFALYGTHLRFCFRTWAFGPFYFCELRHRACHAQCAYNTIGHWMYLGNKGVL